MALTYGKISCIPCEYVTKTRNPVVVGWVELAKPNEQWPR